MDDNYAMPHIRAEPTKIPYLRGERICFGPRSFVLWDGSGVQGSHAEATVWVPLVVPLVEVVC